MTSYFNGKSHPVVEGVWKEGDGVQITIVNVYSSGSLKEKKEIWDEISSGGFNKTGCGVLLGTLNQLEGRRREKV